MSRHVSPGLSIRQDSARLIVRCSIIFFALLVAHSSTSAAQERNSSPAPSPLAHNEPQLRTADRGRDLHILVGRSEMMTAAIPLRRVYVGNPAVLGAFTSGTNELVLTAKEAGVSSLVLWDQSGSSHLYTVFADLDPERLRASIADAFPESLVHVETGEGKVFLTGAVATEAASEAAIRIASSYSKDVVNSLHVIPEHGKQVTLKLRVVEVDRTRAQQLGINLFAQGRTPFSTSTGQYPSVASGLGSTLTVSNPLDIFLYNEKLNLGLTIQDLEQKQVLQVLAEPTLTTLSGVPARFLSGGEFPFPVAQASSGAAPAITIQFRPYGVKVEFTPTVNADGSIHIKLAPEVSALDFTNAVTLSGFSIPAVSTRRAETEVEVQDGQSFAVSGLLDHRTTESLSKVPGIGDVPVIGQLFRSKNINRSVAELVILVTASVVDPLHGSGAATSPPAQPIPNLEPDTFDATIPRHAGQLAGAVSAGEPDPSGTPRLGAR